MYRLMQPSDWAEVLALWQAQRGDTEEFVRGAVERFAGVQNVYVAEENDHIEAVALAVPVTLQGRPGSYLFGLCGQGSLLLAGLVDTLCAQQKLRGAGFVVALTGAIMTMPGLSKNPAAYGIDVNDDGVITGLF